MSRAAGLLPGLVVSIAVVMQYMASGFSWTSARLRYPYHGVIGAGVLTAGLTGIGSWFVGKPFLTSDFTYVRIPPFEKFELATAAPVRSGRIPSGGRCSHAVAGKLLKTGTARRCPRQRTPDGY